MSRSILTWTKRTTNRHVVLRSATPDGDLFFITSLEWHFYHCMNRRDDVPVSICCLVNALLTLILIVPSTHMSAGRCTSYTISLSSTLAGTCYRGLLSFFFFTGQDVFRRYISCLHVLAPTLIMKILEQSQVMLDLQLLTTISESPEFGVSINQLCATTIIFSPGLC